MSDDQSTLDEDDIVDVLAACDEAMAAGDVRPEADLQADDSDVKRKLRRGLASLRRLNALRPPSLERPPAQDRSTGSWPVADLAARPRPAPYKLGRFTIRRELGRGGCGVVFLAYDPSLRREVALKVPSPDVITTEPLRRRFRREAQAAAALDHPNIVPVFDCGEVGPIPYIASAYCAGPNLSAWTRAHAHPVPFRQAAEIVRTLAEAIRHAHARGILHRDLKPSNVLMAPDEAPIDPRAGRAPGIPRITDFGLASILRPGDDDAGDGAPLTKAGMVFGTPSYMSPEQADGQSEKIGPATDVYGLGCILYELLVGRAPFVSESSLDTLQQVLRDPPVSPRRLRPRLPRNLETICLKCLEKEPRRRYAGAEALADDLGRFLDGKPIAARPSGLIEKSWRWVRREPRVAALLATLVVVAAGWIGGMLWHWERLREKTVAATAARVAAEIERGRSAANFRRARLAVDRLGALARELRSQPRLDATRRSLLSEVSRFYEEFLDEESDDPEVRFEAARASNRLAEVHSALGRWEQARQNLDRAAALLDELLALDPDNPEYRYERATNYGEAGRRLRQSYRDDARSVSFRKAAAIAEGLVRDYPDSAEYKTLLAENLRQFGAVHREQEGREAVARSVALTREMLDADPGDTQTHRALVGALSTQVVHAMDRAQYEEGEEIARLAIDEAGRLVAREPDMPQNQNLLAWAYARYARNLEHLRRDEEAVGADLKALEIHGRLAEQWPEVPDYLLDLARTWSDIGAIRHRQRREAEAETHVRKSIELFEKLLKQHPETRRFNQIRLGERWRILSTILGRSGRHAEAHRAAARAYELAPNEPLVMAQFAGSLAATPDPALRDPARAVRIATRLVGRQPDKAESWLVLSSALGGAGMDDAAGEAWSVAWWLLSASR